MGCWMVFQRSCECFPDSPVEVVLDVLRQVHVEHDELVQVAAAEGQAGGPAPQAAAPLARAAHGVEEDLGRGLHVLQHHLQGDVGGGGASV